jgi:L-ascorbate metabolism protein UlaG (beta-lactamase superfamily)
MAMKHRKAKILFRWLGAAGIEIRTEKDTLVIDPYFTRISFWQQWFGRLQSDTALAERMVPACDHILVTHAHWDHVMDVPAVASHTRARVYGSLNTCQLLRVLGIAEEQVVQLQPDTNLQLGSFEVKIRSAEHMPVPVFTPGPLAPDLQPPLRARDYRMDVCLCFHITTGNVSLLTDPGESPAGLEPADVLLISPHYAPAQLRLLMEQVRPRLVMPNHWDNIWLPLSRPARAMMHPPRSRFPFFGRMNLEEFERNVKKVAPARKVFIPQRLVTYDLSGLLVDISIP